MSAYPYEIGQQYFHTSKNTKFRVVDIEQNEHDPELTVVRILWDNGTKQKIYANQYTRNIHQI